MFLFHRVSKMGRTLPTTLFFSLLWVTCLGCKYANVGRYHTMCVYKAHACPNSQLLRSGGISAADKDLILKVHNQIRSKVALGKVRGLPPAADMRVMAWDNELARIAQMWADQCTDGHDKLRDTEKESVGQNVALRWTYSHKDPIMKDRPDWSHSIDLWAREYGQFGFHSGHISPFVFNHDVGHYTQMIWADTHKIGCGFAYYKHPQRGYTKIYVCNYSPGGNIIQGTMYKISPKGATCVDPSLQFSREHRGLCEKGHHRRIKRRKSNRNKREHSRSRSGNSRTFHFSKRQETRRTKRRQSTSPRGYLEYSYLS
uniref:CAP protein n=1 Tax=Megacormus gertschi TaxID=1843536 RepID=A0A224X3L0_9SCOR